MPALIPKHLHEMQNLAVLGLLDVNSKLYIETGDDLNEGYVLVGDVLSMLNIPAGIMTAAIYDQNGNGVVDNSERLGDQLPAYYLDLTNHTGTLAQSQVTNLLADLALLIPLSQKGVANGVVPLNASGVIDAIYLPFTIYNYVGTWDVVANTPALSDATGTANDAYIVTTAGAGGTVRNLGSGNITWFVGDTAIHNGSIWTRIPSTNSPVLSVNGFTGNVVLDTGDINVVTDRNYISDIIEDALLAANMPTAGNPFATIADINFAAFNYQNSWNATTNVPTLADGVGNAGDAYIVSTAGTQDLGSGAITFAVGDMVIMNAALVWQKVSVAFVGVTSVNGFTGAVTLTTDDIPDFANKRYVSDAVLAGLNNAPTTPSAGNPFVTVADVVFGVTNYINSWDVLTNTPVLADGVGTAGDAYIVGVAGTRDLGSGAIVFAVGDLVIYNGAIWQKFSGVAPGVSSVNGFTGAVTLTTANISDSSGRRYLTEIQKQGLDNTPTPPSVTNYFLTKADLPPSVLLSNEWHTPELYSDDQTLGSGAAVTLSSLGYTNGSASAIWNLVPGINVATDTIDWVASYQASMLMANAARQNELHFGLYGARKYMWNKSVPIPYTTTKQNLQYGYNGHNCVIAATGTNNLFDSLPANQTDALNLFINTSVQFRNFALVGIGAAKGSGQRALRVGARDYALYENLVLSGCDYGADLQFNLHGTMKNIYAYENRTDGIRVQDGSWTGATQPATASNNFNITMLKVRAALGSDYGLHIRGCSDFQVFNMTSEGISNAGAIPSQPKAAVFFDDLNSTVVWGFYLCGLHGEQLYNEALIKVKARQGIHEIANVLNIIQGTTAAGARDILKIESYAGVVYVKMNNYRLRNQFDTYNLQSASTRIIFEDSMVQNLPQTTAALVATPIWSNFTPTAALTELRPLKN